MSPREMPCGDHQQYWGGCCAGGRRSCVSWQGQEPWLSLRALCNDGHHYRHDSWSQALPQARRTGLLSALPLPDLTRAVSLWVNADAEARRHSQGQGQSWRVHPEGPQLGEVGGARWSQLPAQAAQPSHHLPTCRTPLCQGALLPSAHTFLLGPVPQFPCSLSLAPKGVLPSILKPVGICSPGSLPRLGTEAPFSVGTPSSSGPELANPSTAAPGHRHGQGPRGRTVPLGLWRTQRRCSPSGMTKVTDTSASLTDTRGPRAPGSLQTPSWPGGPHPHPEGTSQPQTQVSAPRPHL